MVRVWHFSSVITDLLLGMKEDASVNRNHALVVRALQEVRCTKQAADRGHTLAPALEERLLWGASLGLRNGG